MGSPTVRIAYYDRMANRGKRTFPKSPKVRVSPARWVAYQTLREWEEGEGTAKFVEDLLLERWGKSNLKEEDRRLSRELVYGVLRRLRLLDFWIDKMAKQGIESIPAPAVRALRIGLYQLAFLDRIPAHAAVHESVTLCEAIGATPMKGLVNALLRAFSRRREELDRSLEDSPNRLAIETSHPDWLVEWAVERWGLEKAALWLVKNNEEPRTYLRPVVSKFGGDTDPERAADQLIEEMGFGERVGETSAVLLPKGQSVRDMEAFEKGLATVQDLAAQQAVELLDPKEGERVYDLCCAPGGKTVQIADRVGDTDRVVSVDSHPGRLKRVRENLERVGFKNVKTLRHDLLEPWENDVAEKADAVLLDAPCSGLGTLRRRVDLRYRLAPADVEELAVKAVRLLEVAADLVRPGGRLVYSTCTLSREENRDAVDAFIEKTRREWEIETMRIFPSWLEEGPAVEAAETPDSDGAFMALLVKTGGLTSG